MRAVEHGEPAVRTAQQIHAAELVPRRLMMALDMVEFQQEKGGIE
jgi:hypothetical protein